MMRVTTLNLFDTPVGDSGSNIGVSQPTGERVAKELNKAEMLYDFFKSAQGKVGGAYRDRLGELLNISRDSPGELLAALGLLQRSLTDVGEELKRIEEKTGERHHEIFAEI